MNRTGDIKIAQWSNNVLVATMCLKDKTLTILEKGYHSVLREHLDIL